MSELKNIPSFRLIKTFGRLKGRSLSKNQKLGLAMLKEKYDSFLDAKKKIWLEVGFGNGDHLVELAKRNCDKLIVGSEVYENGVATACFSLFQNKIQNARVFHGDVRDLLNLFKHETSWNIMNSIKNITIRCDYLITIKYSDDFYKFS